MASKGYPVRRGSMWISWYQYGHDLFGSRLPRPAAHEHPHMRQGWDAALRQHVKVYGAASEWLHREPVSIE